jgi:hypothetical protein
VPQRLAKRTALIHSLDPRGQMFVVVLNNSSTPTEFAQMKDAADYIGVDPYPCNVKNEFTGCTYAALRQRIDQALGAGIPSAPENALGLPGQYEHLLAYLRSPGAFGIESKQRHAPLSVDDEIAGVQVYGSDIFQQQGVIAIERDQRIATLLGFGRKSRS